MKPTIFFLLCAMLAFVLVGEGNTSAQEQAQALPRAPAASAKALAKLVESGAYQYGVSVQSMSGDEKIEIGRSNAKHPPPYTAVAAKGMEAFAGIPMKTDGKVDTELPCSLYYKIKVVKLQAEQARVKLTVGFASDAEKHSSFATWKEQVWTAYRDVRLDETDSVEFTAPKNKDVPSFLVRYRVRRFEGNLH